MLEQYTITNNEVTMDQIDHDAACVVQAGQLLEMNCLEYETAAYGLAYKKEDDIYFYISSREEAMHNFTQNAYKENLYYTPMKYFYKRFDVIDESEDEIKENYRYEIAHMLSDSYPEVFFEALEQLTATACPNAAFNMVQLMTERLENCFDLNHLNIFSNLLEHLLQSRLLNKEAYYIFQQWLEKEYEKSTEEAIASSAYRRNYSGFAYQGQDGIIGYFADGVYHLALEKREYYIKKGYVVTPILSIQYYADNFSALQKTRKEFKDTLRTYFNESYLKIMQAFSKLSSGISQQLYQTYADRIATTEKQDAIEAFGYYGHLWNIL